MTVTFKVTVICLISLFFLFNPKDFIYSFQYLRCKLRLDFNRFHVLADLPHAAGSRDHRADEWILQAPGDGQLRKRAIQFLCNRLERVNFCKFLLIGQMIFQPIVSIEGAAAVFGNAVTIFARQQP